MAIKSLHVRQIGLFDSLNVKFNSGFNFITGPNASGKTTILRSISLALSTSSISQFRYRDDAEAWIDFSLNANNYRVGYGKGFIHNADLYQKAQLKQWINPPSSEDIEIYNPSDLINKKINFSPLFISAFRKISYLKINGMTLEENSETQIRKYRDNSAKILDGKDMPNVKQWLINRYFQIEKNWATNERKNWEWLTSKLKEIGPEDSNFNFVEIKRDLEPVFTIKGKKCFLEELSSGYQGILSIIFCVFDWIEGTMDGTNMLVQKAKGTVLIDELDAHLHPEWQLTIRHSLQLLFPKLQFIITTHSPHLIASAQARELLIIPEHQGELTLSPSTKTYSGWNTDQILEELMGVKSLTNKVYSELIEIALDFVEKNDINGLEDSIKKLKKVSHSNDTIVTSLEIKLATLKLKRND